MDTWFNHNYWKLKMGNKISNQKISKFNIFFFIQIFFTNAYLYYLWLLNPSNLIHMERILEYILYTETLLIVLGAQLSSSCFFFLYENATLLWKKVTNESFKVLPIVSYNFCPSPTNQAIFRCLHMSGTPDQPDHVPSTGTSNNRTAQYLGNTAGGVGLPIWAFPGRFQRVWL